MSFYDALDLMVVPGRFHTVPDLWGALDRFLAVPLLFGVPFENVLDLGCFHLAVGCPVCA